MLAEMLPELARKLTGLAFLEPREAVGALRVPGLLGPGRASQLLVDCCYPLALAYPDLVARSGAGERTGRSTAWGLMQRWLDLPGAKYQRTASLRTRLADQGHNSWRNGASQALLDLQSDYCRLGGCAVCPPSDGWRGSRWRVRPGPARTSERLLVKWWAELGFGAGRRPEVRAIGQCASSFKIRD